MSNSTRLKKFKETSIPYFLKKQGEESTFKINKEEKIKLCSSDDFNSVAENFIDNYEGMKAPTIISNVGGFYVTASLSGIASSKCNNSKPYILFFDKKNGNMQNAIFNSYLIQMSSNKEEYIKNLFGLSDSDIIKALKPSLYVSYIEEALNVDKDFAALPKKEKKELLKSMYEDDKENIDREIETYNISNEETSKILKAEFNLQKIQKYIKTKKYNEKEHYHNLVKLAQKNLSGDNLKLFKNIAGNMVSYLASKKNYEDLVRYLCDDIKLNNDYHILSQDDIYEGYKALFGKNISNVKFAPNIDISSEKGVKKLEQLLKEEKFIDETIGNDKVSIDVAFIPHISSLKESYPLIKKNVQDYIMLYKDKNNYFVMNSTATLDKKTLHSIGANFIEKERKERIPIKNVSEIKPQKGYPLSMFMAGANFGNIYHDEVATNNMIDIAIANKIDTVYIQGLIYSTYYHSQTSRRMLSDPTYETLESRLQAAQKLIKKLNKAGIKVVYQMSDEEYHLYEDIFKIYVREQGVKGNDFLARKDLRSEFDWVRPIIIQELIPYLIRSGEDVINFYTDDENKTKVSTICNAIKRYREGYALGALGQYINPEFLNDTEMFKIIYSSNEKVNNTDLSINIMSNPNLSVSTQYARPKAGTIKKAKLSKFAQLNVDSREGLMSVEYSDGQVIMNVPQNIEDKFFTDHPELLPGIKDHVKEDPTFKRVTQPSTSLNHPGSYIITGDAREIMNIVPYYSKSIKMMNEVQRTGKGLPYKVVAKFNDWQIGSLSERLEEQVKFADYAINERHATNIFFDGDTQNGNNFKSFANDNQLLAATGVTNQMVTAVKLVRPLLRNSFGVIKGNIVEDAGVDVTLDNGIVLNTKTINNLIMSHLDSIGLIESGVGLYNNNNRIKKDIDYKTVDLRLPDYLKEFEHIIREELSNINNLESIDIAEGNHERNTDSENKGYTELQWLKEELDNLKEYTGSDVDITFPKYYVNNKGDIITGSVLSRNINGYNHLVLHNAKVKGNSINDGTRNWYERCGSSLPQADVVEIGHYHTFESSVYGDTLYNCNGCMAGTTDFDNKFGYSTEPLGVLNIYLPDGRIMIETVGKDFLNSYQVKDKNIKEKGLDKFIEEAVTQEIGVLGNTDNVQKVYQRKMSYRKD